VLNPPGSDPKIVTATITLASLEGLNSASEMQRLLSVPKLTDALVSLGKSVFSTIETPIGKALKHSAALSKDSTGVHSDRGLPGSNGGNTSKYLGADPNGSTSDLAWVV
jgi:hypothetical protein